LSHLLKMITVRSILFATVSFEDFKWSSNCVWVDIAVDKTFH